MRGRPTGPLGAKKNAILIAAREAFKLFGLKKASIDEICKRANVSRMTFYRKYQDKIELAVEILEEENLETGVQVDQILSGAGSFIQKFEQLRQLSLAVNQKLGEAFIADILAEEPDPRIVESFKKFSEKQKARTGKFLRQGQKDGVVSSKHSMPFLFAMVRILNAAYFDPELLTLIPDPTERSEVMNEFFFFGAKGKKASD